MVRAMISATATPDDGDDDDDDYDGDDVHSDNNGCAGDGVCGG